MPVSFALRRCWARPAISDCLHVRVMTFLFFMAAAFAGYFSFSFEFAIQ